MKRHGEVKALPVLIQKILKQKNAEDCLYLDKDMLRAGLSGLVRWDKSKNQPDYSLWTV